MLLVNTAAEQKIYVFLNYWHVLNSCCAVCNLKLVLKGVLKDKSCWNWLAKAACSFSLLEEIWTYLKPGQQKEETRGGQSHLPAHLSGTQIICFMEEKEVKKKEEEEKPQCKKEREMKKAEEEHTKNVKSNLSSDPRREAKDHYLPHLHPHHPCLTQTTMSVTQSARPVIPTEHLTGWLVTCALPEECILIFLLKMLWEK